MMRLSFKDLKIWQKGILLVDTVYEVTKLFPEAEKYALTTQSRKAANSVPANIAEGSQRTSDKAFASFILIAKGSLAELFSHMTVAKRRGYLAGELELTVFNQIDELDRMLYAFHRTLVAKR